MQLLQVVATNGWSPKTIIPMVNKFYVVYLNASVQKQNKRPEFIKHFQSNMQKLLESWETQDLLIHNYPTAGTYTEYALPYKKYKDDWILAASDRFKQAKI